MDVVAVEHDGAGDARAVDRVVHAVEAAQERGLAAAGRTDHRQHFAAADVDAHALDGVLLAVVDVHVLAVEQRVLDRDRADGLALALDGQRLGIDAAARATARLQVQAGVGRCAA